MLVYLYVVQLHVIEATKFHHQYNSKQQMNVHFVNEYEHLKVGGRESR